MKASFASVVFKMLFASHKKFAYPTSQKKLDTQQFPSWMFANPTSQKKFAYPAFQKKFTYPASWKFAYPVSQKFAYSAVCILNVCKPNISKEVCIPSISKEVCIPSSLHPECLLTQHLRHKLSPLEEVLGGNHDASGLRIWQLSSKFDPKYCNLKNLEVWPRKMLGM